MVVGLVSSAVAQPSVVVEDARLAEGGAADQFGAAVALAGDRALVGARYAADGAGAAMLFRWDGAAWVEEARWTGDEPSGAFGSAVALSGDRAAIGAPGAEAVHVFERSAGEWAPVATLAAPGLPDRGLGGAVALDGDRVLAGAARAPSGDPSAGSVVVFRFDGADWVEEARLSRTGGFGTSVALDGGRALVGAPFDGAPGSATVFLFDGVGWVEDARLAVPGAEAGARAGWSVALAEGRAVVGAPGMGAAVVFEKRAAGWAPASVLRPTGVGGAGWAVDAEGDRILVGAPFDGPGGARSGSAALFVRDGDGWAETATLVASDAARGDQLGRAVALSGSRALVGALPPDDGPRASGMALVYALDPASATGVGEAPSGLRLAPPVPNPSRGGATVAFELAEAAAVRLAVVDALGREVAVLAAGPRAAGRHRAAVPALAPGAYALRLAADGRTTARVLTVAQ